MEAAPTSARNNGHELDRRDESATSEVENFEKRKTLLIGEIRRLEAELKNRTKRLSDLQKIEMQASQRLGTPDEERFSANSNVLSKEFSRSELQNVESNLLSAMNGIDQVLEEARELMNELEEPVRNPKKANNSFLRTMRVLESLDVVLFGKENTQDKGALLMVCPECHERMDIRGNLKLRKNKRIILFTCNFCKSKRVFSLTAIVENMIEANIPG